ncbi:tetratricopeptide repeat protein [Frigidibacter sp. SD6-1]|uniref:tetratricopeptide repeat protein n=1 Tax=Frigidibacter sp. SD6-1 TaxID=3032581 RepID=UPI0032E7FA19
MLSLNAYRKYIVASLWGAVMAIFLLESALAQQESHEEQMNRLFAELADPDNERWERAQNQIVAEWEKSGSPAFDLLLKRGEEAMEAGDFEAAIDHLTALTDQAPDFAEGWNARATAFFLTGRYGPSVADIQHVLALEPRHFGAISGLGLILQELGRKEQALKAFRASLAIHPHQDGISQAAEALEQELSGTEL